MDAFGGADTITFNGGAALTGYLQYAADDIVTLTSGSLGELRGTADADTIAFGGTAATGTIGVASAFGLGFIDMASGADTITFSGGEVSGYLLYDREDIVTLTSGSLAEVRGTADADTIAFGGTAATGRIGVASTFTTRLY